MVVAIAPVGVVMIGSVVLRLVMVEIIGVDTHGKSSRLRVEVQ